MICVLGENKGDFMNDSILNSIKKMLGIDEMYTHFDQDIIIHINSVLSVLTQLGVGPENGFSISNSSITWSSYLQKDLLLEMVKSYMYMKVKLIFDPPLSSAVIASMEKLISESEFRLIVATTPVSEEEVT